MSHDWFRQALALADAGEPDAAEQLLRRAIEGPGQTWVQQAWSYDSLGELYRATGRPAEAEECFRRAIALHEEHGWPDWPHDRGRLALAELIVETRQEEKYGEASAILGDKGFLRRRRFNVELFRQAVAAARLCELMGATDEAFRWANRALRLAAIREPQLPQHPDVGVVDERDPALPEMRAVAERYAGSE